MCVYDAIIYNQRGVLIPWAITFLSF